MSEDFGVRVKPVQTAFRGPERQIAAPVAHDALDRITDQGVGIVGIVDVAGKAFGGWDRIIDARIRGDPQITPIIFYPAPWQSHSFESEVPHLNIAAERTVR
jgi:hypothetical protein